ncbi:oligosaccharyl transferase subunit ost3/OST6 [Gnomoniopsis smithogilvyi]|uniref:Oligosaccharyl transferase subunit ost3/OST6 n=1 Tax=Gnomoniopsis smithogilvyi TaxID=1191159 RepID=A0A9W8Z198_9PEZI|nr:oligosaccharyl transferase subunit ost3/OST6 [Gnomoniopsis smithogilvyi]
MRWSSILLPFTLLAAGALAEGPSQRFLDLHKKALASAPVKLDDASYKKATSLPRDYSVAVLLTATDPRFGCQMCREFGPDWNLLSSQWTKGDKAGDSKVVFTVLDFNDGRDTFMSLGLQTAPVLLLFPPTTGEFAVPSADPLRFDFNSGKPSAETAREWIVRHTPGRPHPEFSRPTDWFKIMLTTVSGLGIVSALYAFFPYIELIWTSKYVWRILGLFWILAHSSGFMFNSIRGTQYAGQDGKGGISYIAGGFQSQYQLESQIIGVAYGLLALSAIALADKIPRLNNPRIQSMAVLAWGGFMLVGYSLLLSIFRIKNGGYPFSLPPFL